MLKKELIKANPALSGLTDEQVKAIETLSANDEDAVISKKIAEIHTQYDADIKEVTGRDKPGGVKTFVHLKQVLKELNTKAESAGDTAQLKTEIEKLKDEKAKLEGKIASGSQDQALKERVNTLETELRDKTSELDQVRTTLDTTKTDLESKLKEAQTSAIQSDVQRNIDSYVQEKGIVYNDAIPQTVLEEMLNTRRSSMMEAYTPDYVTNDAGTRTLVFRDKDGEIVRNEANGLRPFTAGELYAGQVKDLIKEGVQRTGTGAKPTNQNPNPNSAIDISSARTQVEADDLIAKHVTKVEGIAVTSRAYGQRIAELRSENNVAELPMQEVPEE